jgi:hypothetical protein
MYLAIKEETGNPWWIPAGQAFRRATVLPYGEVMVEAIPRILPRLPALPPGFHWANESEVLGPPGEQFRALTGQGSSVASASASISSRE